MNTFTWTTTCNTTPLLSMPQHQSAYAGKPVFMRLIGVAVAAVRGVISLK